MLSLSWKIHGYIKTYQHPTTSHTSYVCNVLGWYTIECPRCHLHFLHIPTFFNLFGYICKENTCTCDLLPFVSILEMWRILRIVLLFKRYRFSLILVTFDQWNVGGQVMQLIMFLASKDHVLFTNIGSLFWPPF